MRKIRVFALRGTCVGINPISGADGGDQLMNDGVATFWIFKGRDIDENFADGGNLLGPSLSSKPESKCGSQTLKDSTRVDKIEGTCMAAQTESVSNEKTTGVHRPKVMSEEGELSPFVINGNRCMTSAKLDND